MYVSDRTNFVGHFLQLVRSDDFGASFDVVFVFEAIAEKKVSKATGVSEHY